MNSMSDLYWQTYRVLEKISLQKVVHSDIHSDIPYSGMTSLHLIEDMKVRNLNGLVMLAGMHRLYINISRYK